MSKLEDTPERRETLLARKRELATLYRRAKGSEPRKFGATSAPGYKAAANKRTRAKLRLALFARYGSVCACCGKMDHRFLSLHHKNGDGGKERKETGMDKKSCAQRYNHYLAQPKRDDLELKCYNCHFSQDWYGLCPHNDPTSDEFIPRQLVMELD